MCSERSTKSNMSAAKSVSDQMRFVTISPSVPELWLPCNDHKSVFAQHYDVTVKLTFVLLDIKYRHFVILSH